MLIADSDDPSILELAMIHEQDSQESVHDLLPQEDVPAEAVEPAPKTERSAGQATLPTIQTPSLPEVYALAGVRVPPHGFSILKVAEILSSVHIRELNPDAKQTAGLPTLAASNTQGTEATEDAARRARVLNDYQASQLQIFQNSKT